jgi:ATP-dependent Clp protease ATP-binding subunit ClpA
MINLSLYPFLREVKKPKIKVLGREKELDFLQETRFKKRMKNVILVGEAGCGKTAIIEEFAYRNKGQILVLELDLALATAGTQFRGDFEKKINDAIREVLRYKELPVILYIDEIHTILKSGATDCMSLGDIIKPLLSSEKITVIGATTPKEYEISIKRDFALKRRLSPIYIKKLDKNAILDILNKFIGGTKTVARNVLLEYIYDITSSFENEVGNSIGISNPDISIEVLDRCQARSQYKQVPINKQMIDDVFKELVEWQKDQK